MLAFALQGPLYGDDAKLVRGETPKLAEAFSRMYSQDFAAARRLADTHIGKTPQDPFGYAVRASSDLFHELDRLALLEGEFFADDKRVAEKRKLQADPAIRERFYKDVDTTVRLATAQAAANGKDTNALFALCLAEGLRTDYLSLVEKRQWASFQHVKQSHRHAARLLEVDPNFVDAYLTTGFSEYLIASVPYVLRWAVRFEGVQGDKKVALSRMERVARSGRYLAPFAKILLAIAHLREKRPQQSANLLAELAHEFPENRLYRKELLKVTERFRLVPTALPPPVPASVPR